jgi:hypothetical protein
MVALAAQMHKSEPIFNDIFQSQKFSNEFSDDFSEKLPSVEDYLSEKKDISRAIIRTPKHNIDWMPDIKNLPKGFPK